MALCLATFEARVHAGSGDKVIGLVGSVNSTSPSLRVSRLTDETSGSIRAMPCDSTKRFGGQQIRATNVAIVLEDLFRVPA